MNLEAKVFNQSMWNDLVDLFGKDGASDGCWCMSWRSEIELKGNDAKEAFKSLVEENKVQGILVYQNQKPIGWTTFGSRRNFPNANNHPDFRELSSDTFSIPCFFVRGGYRGKGVSQKLLTAAIDAIKSYGVRTLEAYPVKESESDQIKEDWSFTGSLKLFSKNGFKSCNNCKHELECLRLDL